MTTATRPFVPGEDAVLERAGTENFPVASLVLGRATRDHLLGVYGFARLVDELGDAVEGDRLGHLDWLEQEVDRMYGGEPEHPLMRRLAPTVRACSLPRAPFVRLIDANRRDQRQARYETYDDLVDYCDLSANPVGELVLHVFGAATPERVALSDRVCTALQLLEHWQDVEEDYANGRVYLPAEDLERFHIAPGAFSGEAYEQLLAFEIERARQLLDEGAPLVGTLRGRARVAVSGYVGGGRAGFDSLARGVRKAPKGARVAATLATLVRGR
jgi:squalene synthase HpnC